MKSVNTNNNNNNNKKRKERTQIQQPGSVESNTITAMTNKCVWIGILLLRHDPGGTATAKRAAIKIICPSGA